jgi:hypothetical protein
MEKTYEIDPYKWDEFLPPEKQKPAPLVIPPRPSKQTHCSTEYVDPLENKDIEKKEIIPPFVPELPTSPYKHPFGGGCHSIDGYEMWQWIKSKQESGSWWWKYCLLFYSNEYLYNLSVFPDFGETRSAARLAYVDKVMRREMNTWPNLTLLFILLAILTITVGLAGRT